MNIQAEKISLAQLLLQTDDIKIIEKVKAIFTNDKKDWWDELSEEQKFEIEESDREIDRGEFVFYVDFIKKYI